MKSRIALVAVLATVAGIVSGCSSTSEKDGVSIEKSHWYDIF